MRRRLSLKMLKYLSIAEIELRNMWAYAWDQIISLSFLACIMFVFVALWRTTYASTGKASIDGFSLNDMIWYLVATESIILSLPRIHGRIAQDVRNGDIALSLGKPYVYLLFLYGGYVGVGLVRFCTALLIGGAVSWLMVGGIAFDWSLLPIFLVLYFTTQAMHFCYSASVGLISFWTEDITGIFFLFDRLKWMLGGMLLPLEIFPGPVRAVADLLPFRAMIYDPARLVVRFSWEGLAQVFLMQFAWLALLVLVLTGLFRLGVRRVEMNGG